MKRFVEQGSCRPVVDGAGEDGSELLQGVQLEMPVAPFAGRGEDVLGILTGRGRVAEVLVQPGTAKDEPRHIDVGIDPSGQVDRAVNVAQRFEQAGDGLRGIGGRYVVRDRRRRLSGLLPVVCERRVLKLHRGRLERLSRAPMQLLAPIAQQGRVCHLLHESMRERTAGPTDDDQALTDELDEGGVGIVPQDG